MSRHFVETFWTRLAEWSRVTFGDDVTRDALGPLKHLAKEAQEAEDAAVTLRAVLASLDAARRSGMTLEDLLAEAAHKLAINKTREWPRPTSDEPVEHVRDVRVRVGGSSR